MTGPIKTIIAGCQSGSGFPSAPFTAYFEGTPDIAPNSVRHLIRVHNSTMVGATLTALGSQHGQITMRVPLLYRQFGWWLKAAFGDPYSISSGAGALSGVWTRTFNLGALTLPKFGFKLYNNVFWTQALNYYLNTMRITGGATEPAMAELTWLGDFPTKCDAPTVPELIDDVYNPAGDRELLAQANSQTADCISFTSDITNNLTPFFTARRIAGMKRAKRGLADAKLDAMFDLEDYDTEPAFTKDYYGSSDPGAIVLNYTGSTAIVNTTYPEIELKYTDFKMEQVQNPDDGTETAQHVTGQGTYSGTNTPKGSFVVKLVNDQNAASYAAS